MPVVRCVALLGLLLSACSAATPAAPTPTQADAFAVVRATSEAAYRSGVDHLNKDELEAALVDLDRAKTNDPDNRREIQQALDETVRRIQALPPTTPTPGSPSGPGPGSLVTPPVVALATRAAATPGAAASPTGAAASPAAAASPVLAAAQVSPAGFAVWRDPQGRFSIGAPRDWQTLDAPPSMFGTGVVGFRDPGGRAELDLAVDSAARAVSPELYAASMELTMQQLPGYALESIQPGTTAGSPSIKRVFTQTRQDAAGRDYTARGFQIALLRGSTAYVVSAFAPAPEYAQVGPTLDRMVDSLALA